MTKKVRIDLKGPGGATIQLLFPVQPDLVNVLLKHKALLPLYTVLICGLYDTVPAVTRILNYLGADERPSSLRAACALSLLTHHSPHSDNSHTRSMALTMIYRSHYAVQGPTALTTSQSAKGPYRVIVTH